MYLERLIARLAVLCEPTVTISTTRVRSMYYVLYGVLYSGVVGICITTYCSTVTSLGQRAAIISNLPAVRSHPCCTVHKILFVELQSCKCRLSSSDAFIPFIVGKTCTSFYYYNYYYYYTVPFASHHPAGATSFLPLESPCFCILNYSSCK